MNGASILARIRLFLLAVTCWLCIVPAAHAIRPPSPAELQLREETAQPAQPAYEVVWAMDAEGRIGLFCVNNPLRYNDPSGHFLNALGNWEFNEWYEWTGIGPGDVSSQPLSLESHHALMVQYGMEKPMPGPNGTLISTPADAVNVVFKNVAGSLLTAMPIGGEDKVGVEEGGKVVSSLEERAKELHGLLNPRAQRMRTTAVTATEEGVTFVSSSENALSKAQKVALKPGEVAAEGAGHAETTGLNAASQAGFTPTATAASRPICPTCAQALKQAGVTPASPLKKVPGQ